MLEVMHVFFTMGTREVLQLVRLSSTMHLAKLAMKHKVAIQVMKNQPPIIMINIQEGTLQIYCIINLEAKRFEWHGFLSIEYHQHR
jgi:hypothetical protein